MNIDLQHALTLFRQKKGEKLLAFDYDGTLAPPVTININECTLHQNVSDQLNRLLANDLYRVAIVSGRSILSLKTFLGERDHLILAGDHGVHIECSKFSYIHEHAEACSIVMPQVISLLISQLKAIKGICFELKPYSSAVIFRGIHPSLFSEIIDTVHQTVGQYPGLTLLESECVFEICPNISWHKGYAIDLIAKKYGISKNNILFVGDAENDELGFSFLPDACTIRVGNAPTAARFHISKQESIELLLSLF